MRKIYFLLLFLILLPYGMKAQDAYPSTVSDGDQSGAVGTNWYIFHD